MDHPRRIKVFSSVVAVLAVLALAFAPNASATTYTWSGDIKCKFLTDAGTVVATDIVRARINNTGTQRRVDFVRVIDPTNGESRIDSATFAELDGLGNKVGAGTYYKPNIPPPNIPYNFTLGQLSTTQMPYIGNTTPMQIQFHLHRVKSPGQECVVRHSY